MFVFKFFIGIIVLITICLNFFRIAIAKDVSSNRKLFNFLVFLLILIFLFQFGLNFTMHRTVMHKLGYPGEPGIRGQIGDKGNTGKCVSDCGRKVCDSVLTRDANNALTYYTKKVINKLEDGEELKRTLVRCANNSIEEKGENAVIKLPKIDLDVCKKTDKTLSGNPKTRSDNKCISVEEVQDSIFGNNKLEIYYNIKNKLFLNKLKLICYSKQYLSTLEKEHEKKPTEKKLIEYLSSIVIKWVELISSFKFMIEKTEVNEDTGEKKKVRKPIYIGLVFLMAPDAEFNVIENIEYKEDGVNKVLESPLREIEKYDIWHWGKTTTESPLIVTTCLAKQSPPLAIQQKLKTIYTNNYDVIFNSRAAYPDDIWDITNCPYGQMGDKDNNPKNMKFCITNETNENSGEIDIVKKLAWKTTEYRRKTEITFLHPKRHTDKNNKKYYPIGSVWTTLKPNNNGKYGKKTLLVTGNIMPPEDYIKIWTSKYIQEDKRTIFKPDVVITIWRPKAPNGYIALGDVITKGTKKPSINLSDTPIVCVAESCVSTMPLGSEIWNTNDIARIDYRSEFNYRMYNNLHISIDKDQNTNNNAYNYNPYSDDTTKLDKDDDMDYPSLLKKTPEENIMMIE